MTKDSLAPALTGLAAAAILYYSRVLEVDITLMKEPVSLSAPLSLAFAATIALTLRYSMKNT